MRNLCLFFLLLSLKLVSQNENASAFDKYGPYGAEVYKDLKAALKIEKNIFKMDLSYQQLDPKLFGKIAKLKDLQALRLSSNSINQWPDDFTKLNSLVYLASINNEFTGFPKDMKYLGSLMYLELFGTKIDSLPYELAYLQRLKTFKFTGNEDTLRVTNKLRYIKTLNELTIENAILDSCPRALFRIPSAKFLSLSNCKIQALPENLDKLGNLEALILDFNKLQTIPRHIYKCKKLIYLSLKNNQIRKIPDTICQLQSLTQLDLRGNPLTQDDIDELKILLPGCKVLF